MFDAAVTNASPLIYLGRTGNIHLLQHCARDVSVPDAVVHEIRAAGTDDAAAQAMDTCAWLQVVSVSTVPPQIAAWNLGIGESAVLAWAVANPGTWAIIDDLEGRRCASQLRIRVVGTLGLVLAAKRRGTIPTARAVIEALIGSGLYLSDDVVADALALVGE